MISFFAAGCGPILFMAMMRWHLDSYPHPTSSRRALASCEGNPVIHLNDLTKNPIKLCAYAALPVLNFKLTPNERERKTTATTTMLITIKATITTTIMISTIYWITVGDKFLTNLFGFNVKLCQSRVALASLRVRFVRLLDALFNWRIS